MEYLNGILKVNNSLLKVQKELEDFWSFKMSRHYYIPDPRIYCEGYGSIKEPRKQISLCLKL